MSKRMQKPRRLQLERAHCNLQGWGNPGKEMPGPEGPLPLAPGWLVGGGVAGGNLGEVVVGATIGANGGVSPKPPPLCVVIR